MEACEKIGRRLSILKAKHNVEGAIIYDVKNLLEMLEMDSVIQIRKGNTFVDEDLNVIENLKNTIESSLCDVIKIENYIKDEISKNKGRE